MNKHKNLKKLIVIICAVFIISTVLFGACYPRPQYLGAINYIDINSVEDLYAMERDKSYKLNCNIDLQGNYWTPLSIRAFDGNGYKISNCIIKDVHEENEYWAYGKDTAFFSTACFIENITFDNITVIATNANQIAVVVGCFDGDELGGEYIKNVQVRNCKITGVASNADIDIGIAIIAGYGNGESITNCIIESCNIDCNMGFNSRVGIVTARYGKQYKNISVKNCNVTINFNCSYGSLYFGGLVAYGDNIKAENCNVDGNNCTINSISDRSNIFVGGMVGYMSSYNTDCKIGTSVCSDNTFNVTTNSSYIVGGIAGECYGQIDNCLSENNIIKGNITKQASSAVMGGLCGSSHNTNKNSVVQNCSINGVSSSNKNICTAGAVGKVNASVAYCLVNNCIVSGSPKYVFSPKSDLIFHCYLYNCSDPNNIGGLSVIDQNKWANVLDILNFDKSIWGQGATGDLYLI